MTEMCQEIGSSAPMENVFGYVGHLAKLPRIRPSLMEAKDLQYLPNGGASFESMWSLAGLQLGNTGANDDLL